MELQAGETAHWTVYFDPRHHGTCGDHNHSVILKSNDAVQAELEVPTVANVIEEESNVCRDTP